MSSQVSHFNPATHLNVPYGQKISFSSQQIIETASYTTTPSSTPPAKEYQPFSIHDHHRSGPTIAAIIQAVQVLKAYREKEEKLAARPISVAAGNYQRACADQTARQSQPSARSPARCVGDASSGGLQARMSSEQDMCPWSYEDKKRKMHLGLMCDKGSWSNCKSTRPACASEYALAEMQLFARHRTDDKRVREHRPEIFPKCDRWSFGQTDRYVESETG
jgi:hypothetical protein